MDAADADRMSARFLDSLALSGMPARDLFALYQGWLDRVAALGSRADHRNVSRCPERRARRCARRDGLDAHAQLQRDIAACGPRPQREKQLNRRVELNLEIERLEAELAATRQRHCETRTPHEEDSPPRTPRRKSRRLVAENIEQLKALFPEAFTEGKVDFEVLKQLLGGAVDEREEKYGLNWHGKRRARQLALTPSTGTLRPCPEESVDWDTTQNLMIEGDNLEVLKLFQKSYAGKVKLIYIDPPYNTGKDFVYPDDFQDNIKNYLELTGQVDGRWPQDSCNTEASGRFHTDWLNMMYPRLKLARALLRPDGAIFISIDDTSYPT